MNFLTDTLTKVADDIERPPLMPPGTYVWMVEKQPEHIDKPEWEILEFRCKCVRPTDDVDTDALREFGELKNVRQRYAFIFDKNDETSFKRAEFNLKQFLNDHLKCWERGASMKEALSAAVNSQFLGSIKWTPDKNNKEMMFANISKTAPVE